MKTLLATTLIALSLAGCASVTLGDATQDERLKTFAVTTGKTGIYIFRNETLGAATKMDVAIDGQSVGQTAANTYLFKQVNPGQHVISSQGDVAATITVDAKPGTLVYVWQEVKLGFLSAGSRLQVVPEALGQKGVSETRLAAGQ